MRPPGYETLDGIGAGRPLEFTGRETMTRRSQSADIGRYGHGQRDPDAATRVRDEDLADVELRQMRLRMLELSA